MLRTRLRFRTTLAAIALAALALPAIPGFGVPEAGAEWRWFEGDRTFEPLTADPREPRLGFDYIEGGSWSAKAGGAATLASIVGTPLEEARASADGARVSEPRPTLRLGIDGMAWLWLSTLPDYNFPLETVDGTIGIWLESSEGPWSGRLRLYHWSGHLGDGADDVATRRIVYSREILAVIVSRDVSPTLRLYGGPTTYLSADPHTQAFQFQFGGRLGSAAPSGTASPGPPSVFTSGVLGAAGGAQAGAGRSGFYAAFDMRMKAESEYRGNQSYKVGFRMGSTPGNSLRIAAGYTNGNSERGQYWQTPEHYFSLGAFFGD